jgi:hypothetical protein
MKLRKLMDEPEIELRYGAFNALRTLDANDAFLGHLQVVDEPKHEDNEDEPSDSMAVAITNASRRRNAHRDDPFNLYVVDSEGPPLIHISRSRRSEIVVFGRDQKLLPPIVLDTGTIFLNAAASDDKLELSKIVPNRFTDADVKTTTSLELADVVRKTANLGATYPQIVAILENAKRQRNLAGDLVVDAVPVSNRVYLEAVLGKDTTAKRDDAVKKTSGESSRSRGRWLFGIFGRDSDDSASDNKGKAAPKSPAQDLSPSADPVSPPTSTPTSTSTSATAAGDDGSGKSKPSTGTAGGPPVKKDDAVQKATADESPPPRRRLFDFFRRDDES